eukprot:COSAG01_NODE_14331_length_1467_cov_1.706140_2_plen_204_part_00
MAEDQLLDELMARLTMADSVDTAPDAIQQQQQEEEEVRDTVGARKCMTEELSAYLREATACRSATEELMAALGKLVHGQVSLMTEGGGEAQMCAIGAADAAVRGVAVSVASRVDQLQRATHARMVTLGGGCSLHRDAHTGEPGCITAPQSGGVRGGVRGGCGPLPCRHAGWWMDRPFAAGLVHMELVFCLTTCICFIKKRTSS